MLGRSLDVHQDLSCVDGARGAALRGKGCFAQHRLAPGAELDDRAAALAVCQQPQLFGHVAVGEGLATLDGRAALVPDQEHLDAAAAGHGEQAQLPFARPALKEGEHRRRVVAGKPLSFSHGQASGVGVPVHGQY
jgi:hypothetical protein